MPSFKSLLFLVIPFIVSCNQSNTERFDLKKLNWNLQSFTDSIAVDSVDPGDVHLALMSKGIIGDPFFRDNEKKVQWVGNTSWCFSTTFDVNSGLLSQKEVNMVFEGLDTYAQVWLNDSLVLTADNMFRKWAVPVKKVLRKRSNHLRICFYSPNAMNKVKAAKCGVPLPEIRAFTRKAPYQSGWDWGPTLITMGIWKPAYLEARNGDARLLNPFIQQQFVSDSVAKIMVNTDIETTHDQQVKLSVLVNGELMANTVLDLQSGKNPVRLPIELNFPALWYPNGVGEPQLTSITIVLNDDIKEAVHIKTGLRRVELIQTPDKPGAGFQFNINGKPLYIKGANMIPEDNFLTRVTRGRTRDLLNMAKQSNINMLRVWGGGVYGSDDFYDLCDSLGILVWQDFMFAGTVYPGDSAFVENVRQEARQQVIRLRNHPSLALWCGNNEVDEAWHNWGWQKSLGYSKSDSTKLWNDYLHLFEGMLPQIVDEYNPGMLYVPSSPATGWGREEAYRHGDVHYWGVWWGEEPFESFNAKVGRFVSEYGFQGMPDPKTIASFTWPEDRNPDSEVMAVHQKHARGKELIHSYMEQNYRVPENFEE
ncbi:MAG: glycoside hydrolase family 2 TIM barrel-domain containing protein [Bacteroidales bacterium]|jgi:beta-mannosidase